MQFFLNTMVDLRLEIQPALKLSSVSGTLGVIAKVILVLICLTMKRKKKSIFENFSV